MQAAVAEDLSQGTINQLGVINLLQQPRALKRVNAIADSCFRQCVVDFVGTKHLRSGEEDCISRCVEKYVLLSTGVGGAFADTLEQHPNNPYRSR